MRDPHRRFDCQKPIFRDHTLRNTLAIDSKVKDGFPDSESRDGAIPKRPRLPEERMFNLLQSASNDQTVIGASLLTMIGAAFLVFTSYHLGPVGQKLRDQERRRLDLKLQSDAQHARERAA